MISFYKFWNNLQKIFRFKTAVWRVIEKLYVHLEWFKKLLTEETLIRNLTSDFHQDYFLDSIFNFIVFCSDKTHGFPFDHFQLWLAFFKYSVFLKILQCSQMVFVLFHEESMDCQVLALEFSRGYFSTFLAGLIWVAPSSQLFLQNVFSIYQN